jgi:hypothetical protein
MLAGRGTRDGDDRGGSCSWKGNTYMQDTIFQFDPLHAGSLQHRDRQNIGAKFSAEIARRSGPGSGARAHKLAIERMHMHGKPILQPSCRLEK